MRERWGVEKDQIGGVEEEHVCGLQYCSYLPFCNKRRY